VKKLSIINFKRSWLKPFMSQKFLSPFLGFFYSKKRIKGVNKTRNLIMKSLIFQKMAEFAHQKLRLEEKHQKEIAQLNVFFKKGVYSFKFYGQAKHEAETNAFVQKIKDLEEKDKIEQNKVKDGVNNFFFIFLNS
jgi:hypothetical protein